MLTAPVDDYMTRRVISVQGSTRLLEADRLLDLHRISSLPVVDGQGECVGVISRADLLLAGKLASSPVHGRAALELPEGAIVSTAMSTEVLKVAPNTSVSEAASLLVDHQIHRVFVEDQHRLVGVFSTKDVMRAIVDAGVDTPIDKLMRSPVDTVSPGAPLSRAIQMLEASHHSGLVIEEAGWPLGVFTNIEALHTVGLPADTPVRLVMGFSLLRLPTETPVGQAAGEAYATRARRIVAMTWPAEIRGILTGIDLAGAAIIST